MELNIELKQTLELKMTQQLIQAIELLQFSSKELHEFIQQQVEENPFLEWNSSPDNFSSHSAIASTHDIIEATLSEQENLYDVLLEQLITLHLSEKMERIVTYIIYCLDENGYLCETEENIKHHLSITVMEFEKALNYVHSLQPYGVGARNVAECLSIQANHIFPNDSLLQKIIHHYLYDVAEGNVSHIATDLQITEALVEKKIEQIQTSLHPKPASHLGANTAHYIEPDIIVEKTSDENLHFFVNDDFVSGLNFNDSSIEAIYDKEAHVYVRRHRNKYDWLLYSLERRKLTLQKIMDVIIREQYEMFFKGLDYVKPLTLKQVANAIDMHESTVSRATANKFVETPLGIIEMKKFFAKSIQMSNGNKLSTEAVKNKIKHIISKENKTKPLSDQRIASLLREKEIIISRRTVAKYRQEMNILSSTKRKMRNGE